MNCLNVSCVKKPNCSRNLCIMTAFFLWFIFQAPKCVSPPLKRIHFTYEKMWTFTEHSAPTIYLLHLLSASTRRLWSELTFQGGTEKKPARCEACGHGPVTSNGLRHQPTRLHPTCPTSFHMAAHVPSSTLDSFLQKPCPCFSSSQKSPCLSLFFPNLRLSIGTSSFWKSFLIHPTYIFSSLNCEIYCLYHTWSLQLHSGVF